MAKREYKPWLAKAESWDVLEDKYIQHLSDSRLKMLELIRHIKNSDLSHRLFGATSIMGEGKLMVSIYNPIDIRKETLHIRFNQTEMKWYFEYYAMPFEEPEFVRIYAEDKGIEKFDAFIKRVKW